MFGLLFKLGDWLGTNRINSVNQTNREAWTTVENGVEGGKRQVVELLFWGWRFGFEDVESGVVVMMKNEGKTKQRFVVCGGLVMWIAGVAREEIVIRWTAAGGFFAVDSGSYKEGENGSG